MTLEQTPVLNGHKTTNSMEKKTASWLRVGKVLKRMMNMIMVETME